MFVLIKYCNKDKKVQNQQFIYSFLFITSLILKTATISFIIKLKILQAFGGKNGCQDEIVLGSQ